MKAHVFVLFLAVVDVSGLCTEDDSCQADSLLQTRQVRAIVSEHYREESQNQLATLEGRTEEPCVCCKVGYCLVYGDPHFYPFDSPINSDTTLKGKGTFWIVKSDSVQLQGFAKDRSGRFAGIAAGGPFLDGHTLVVRQGNDRSLTVEWDGEEVLKEADTQKFIPGLVELRRASHGLASEEHLKDLPEYTELRGGMREGNQTDYISLYQKTGYYHFKLPGHVEIFTTQQQNMATILKMPSVPGMVGWCGNFNGNASDDQDAGTEFIDGDESWFPSIPEKSGTTKEGSNERGACKGARLEMAQQACNNITGSKHKTCIDDVCTTGDANAAEASFAAEVLEVEDALGIPKRVGPGRCLDSKRRYYTAYQVKEAKKDEDCLKALTEAEGVRGVQFVVGGGGGCEILVDPNQTIEARDKIPGPGELLIESSDEDEEGGYECWRLN